MREFLKERGWTVLTLCFDGHIHTAPNAPSNSLVNARILKDTDRARDC